MPVPASGLLIDRLRDRRSIAELVRWMNAQPRRPGEDAVVYRHRKVRALLQEIGLPLYQKGPRCKVYFRESDLEDKAPLLARAFLQP